jgi:hypothetical protein
MLLRIFNTENGRETVRRSLITRKTFARLVELTSAGATATPAKKAPAKARRATPRKAE